MGKNYVFDLSRIALDMAIVGRTVPVAIYSQNGANSALFSYLETPLWKGIATLKSAAQAWAGRAGDHLADAMQYRAMCTLVQSVAATTDASRASAAMRTAYPDGLSEEVIDWAVTNVASAVRRLRSSRVGGLLAGLALIVAALLGYSRSCAPSWWPTARCPSRRRGRGQNSRTTGAQKARHREHALYRQLADLLLAYDAVSLEQMRQAEQGFKLQRDQHGDWQTMIQSTKFRIWTIEGELRRRQRGR